MEQDTFLKELTFQYCSQGKFKRFHQLYLSEFSSRGNKILNLLNCKGQTPLYVSCQNGHYKLSIFLIEKGADPNARSNDGSTPTHAAAKSCCSNLLKYVVEVGGGDLRLHDYNNMTAVDWLLLLDKRESKKSLHLVEKWQQKTQSTLLNKGFIKRTGYYGLNRRGSVNRKCHGYGDFLCADKETTKPNCAATICSNMQLASSTDITINYKLSWSYKSPPCFELRSALWRGQDVTVKNLKHGKVYNEDLLLNEINSCSQIRHPNILLLLSVCMQSTFEHSSYNACNILIFEHVQFGSLYYLLHKDHQAILPLTSNKILKYLLQISEAIIFLHEEGLVHRAISSHAIHIINEHYAKLGDFICMCNQDHLTQINEDVKYALLRWMLPRIAENNYCNYDYDIYSFCLVVCEALTGNLPWHTMDNATISYQIRFDKLQFTTPEQIPKELGKVLNKSINGCKNNKNFTKISDIAFLIQNLVNEYEYGINQNINTSRVNVFSEKIQSKSCDVPDSKPTKPKQILEKTLIEQDTFNVIPQQYGDFSDLINNGEYSDSWSAANNTTLLTSEMLPHQTETSITQLDNNRNLIKTVSSKVRAPVTLESDVAVANNDKTFPKRKGTLPLNSNSSIVKCDTRNKVVQELSIKFTKNKKNLARSYSDSLAKELSSDNNFQSKQNRPLINNRNTNNKAPPVLKKSLSLVETVDKTNSPLCSQVKRVQSLLSEMSTIFSQSSNPNSNINVSNVLKCIPVSPPNTEFVANSAIPSAVDIGASYTSTDNGTIEEKNKESDTVYLDFDEDVTDCKSSSNIQENPSAIDTCISKNTSNTSQRRYSISSQDLEDIFEDFATRQVENTSSVSSNEYNTVQSNLTNEAKEIKENWNNENPSIEVLYTCLRITDPIKRKVTVPLKNESKSKLDIPVPSHHHQLPGVTVCDKKCENIDEIEGPKKPVLAMKESSVKCRSIPNISPKKQTRYIFNNKTTSTVTNLSDSTRIQSTQNFETCIEDEPTEKNEIKQASLTNVSCQTNVSFSMGEIGECISSISHTKPETVSTKNEGTIEQKNDKSLVLENTLQRYHYNKTKYPQTPSKWPFQKKLQLFQTLTKDNDVLNNSTNKPDSQQLHSFNQKNSNLQNAFQDEKESMLTPVMNRVTSILSQEKGVKTSTPVSRISEVLNKNKLKNKLLPDIQKKMDFTISSVQAEPDSIILKPYNLTVDKEVKYKVEIDENEGMPKVQLCFDEKTNTDLQETCLDKRTLNPERQQNVDIGSDSSENKTTSSNSCSEDCIQEDFSEWCTNDISANCSFFDVLVDELAENIANSVLHEEVGTVTKEKPKT